ncbi:MAG: hypothetical protein AB7U75_10055 [Hyphomicrobiaceae bacterium]
MTEMEYDEVRELGAHELGSVAGGEVRVQVFVREPKSMAELYQNWADLGHLLKTNPRVFGSAL